MNVDYTSYCVLAPALQGGHVSPTGYSDFTQKTGLLHPVRYWDMP